LEEKEMRKNKRNKKRENKTRRNLMNDGEVCEKQ
jgi:hypothetical protein